MIQCPSCGQEIGMNGRCRQCLTHMISEKSGEINLDRALEIVESLGPWEEGRGSAAPERMKSRLRVLSRLVRDAVDGYISIPWGTAARAAFAVHYAVSPADWAPDTLPGVGWQDDETVVDIVIDTERDRITEYCHKSGVAPGEFGL